MELHEKLAFLKEYLRGLESVVVAFSGGVDSTFLLRAAYEVLGDKCVAGTVMSHLVPKSELEGASAFCASLGVRHEVLPAGEGYIKSFEHNPKNRCYLCKSATFERLRALADEIGFGNVAEGSNVDDLGDYRPGLKAVEELGIKSPLREAGLTKAEIRALSKEYGLPTWNKPAMACLASRFVYGETISPERLAMVERAEAFLFGLGLTQLRVRIHGAMARIEALPAEFGTVMRNREAINAEFAKIGYLYTTLDLRGYRTGSMNDTIKKGD